MARRFSPSAAGDMLEMALNAAANSTGAQRGNVQLAEGSAWLQPTIPA